MEVQDARTAESERSGISALQRGLALSALGALVSFGAPCPSSGAAARSAGMPAGPVALWVTDRDADVVWGLGPDLLARARIDVPSPTEVEACADGGAWVLSAVGGGPLGPHRLLRLGATGTIVASTPFETPLDLATVDGGSALVVELGAQGVGRLWRVAADGGARLLLEEPGLVCAAGARGLVLAGTAGGEAILLGEGVAEPLARRSLGGPLGDLAPGDVPGTWWALDIGGSARLLRLAPDLAPSWTTAIGLHPLHITPVPGEERVWIADTTEPAIRRFGPGGALEVVRFDLRLSGLDRGVSWGSGGVLVVAPGALLHLDASGGPAPGQGGFRFLVDAARVAGP